MVTIRNETEADYPRVEDLTRRAFYNLYVPGCHEHYLVHIMRDHREFLPELSFVLELDGKSPAVFSTPGPLLKAKTASGRTS